MVPHVIATQLWSCPPSRNIILPHFDGFFGAGTTRDEGRRQ
jgi:hypothetical protein